MRKRSVEFPGRERDKAELLQGLAVAAASLETGPPNAQRVTVLEHAAYRANVRWFLKV